MFGFIVYIIHIIIRLCERMLFSVIKPSGIYESSRFYPSVFSSARSRLILIITKNRKITTITKNKLRQLCQTACFNISGVCIGVCLGVCVGVCFGMFVGVYYFLVLRVKLRPFDN